MADSVALPRERYIVTVAGAMNPLIHHPHWYRNIGAMDEAELQESLNIPTNATTHIGSRVLFGSPALMVDCQQGQWTIFSDDSSSWPRLLKITSLVFERLNETPVNAYGLIATRHLATETSNVKALMGAALAELNFGVPAGTSVTSTVSATTLEEDFQVTITIQPSNLSEDNVFGSFHQNYPVPQSPGGYFDLGALLATRFEQFLTESNRFFEDIVAAVNSRAGQGQGRE